MPSARTTHRNWSFVLLVLAAIVALFVGFAYQSAATSPGAVSPTKQAVVPTTTPAPPTTAAPLAMPTTQADETGSPGLSPLKAEPVRLTVASASVDVVVSHLEMSSDQINQRDYTPPQTPEGYYVRFTENGVTPFDFPGRDATGATWIIGHSCDGLAVCQENDWQFNRLSDSRLVHVGTTISVMTTAGKVCYRTISATQVGAHDVASQNRILNEAVKQHYLVLTTCYPQDIHGQNTFVIAAMETC